MKTLVKDSDNLDNKNVKNIEIRGTKCWNRDIEIHRMNNILGENMHDNARLKKRKEIMEEKFAWQYGGAKQKCEREQHQQKEYNDRDNQNEQHKSYRHADYKSRKAAFPSYQYKTN